RPGRTPRPDEPTRPLRARMSPRAYRAGQTPAHSKVAPTRFRGRLTHYLLCERFFFGLPRRRTIEYRLEPCVQARGVEPWPACSGTTSAARPPVRPTSEGRAR